MLKLKSISILSIFIILVLTILLISFPNVSFSALRAGVAKVNITKEKPTSLVNDPLFTRALVIDDGKTKAIIVTLDIGGVSEKLLSEVRELVNKNLKLDGNNILINASHNHRVHGQLADDYVNKIVTAIKKANENMVPVKIGAGKGMENRITMNRRLKLTNGKEWTIRHRLPCPPDEEVAGMAGPFDPEIGILRIDKTDGTPFAVLYNFGGHVYGGVPNGGVTACFPGFASSTIEEYLGNDVIAMFIQGAEGDITPTLFKDYNAPKPEVEHGTKLGLSTLKAVQSISTKKEGDLKVVREEFEFPHRTDVQMRIDSFEAEKKVLSDY
ncbi:hypothetical protein KAS50_02815, partial [bacterium]|nr:hypothetical protein [bacterium]